MPPLATVANKEMVNAAFETTLDQGLIGDAAVAESLAQSRKTSMRLKAPLGPVWVKADKQRMSQVMTNLIQNAIKYGNDAGKVVMRPDLIGGLLAAASHNLARGAERVAALLRQQHVVGERVPAEPRPGVPPTIGAMAQGMGDGRPVDFVPHRAAMTCAVIDHRYVTAFTASTILSTLGSASASRLAAYASGASTWCTRAGGASR